MPPMGARSHCSAGKFLIEEETGKEGGRFHIWVKDTFVIICASFLGTVNVA
jgi:hypothetical protein